MLISIDSSTYPRIKEREKKIRNVSNDIKFANKTNEQSPITTIPTYMFCVDMYPVLRYMVLISWLVLRKFSKTYAKIEEKEKRNKL